jgi:SAM-dependent methyltransferase
MSGLHFGSIAARWKLVGPPLRPTEPDLEAFRRCISRAPSSVLILGVTPELFHLGFPASTRVQALDASQEMIGHVWPGSADSAHLGSWTDPPWSKESFDLVICDGGFGLLPPSAQAKLLSQVDDLLSPGGQFVVRLFAPQGKTGTLSAIRNDLLSKNIPSLDALKLRLWGALQTSSEEGVSPRHVVAHIDEFSGGARSLETLLDWPLDHLLALDVHRTSEVRYHLVDAQQLVALASSTTALRLQSTEIPAHPFGECCPVVSLLKG